MTPGDERWRSEDDGVRRRCCFDPADRRADAAPVRLGRPAVADGPRFRNLCILVVATLATGILFYSMIEGWSLLDSFYFSAITLTTVGYGDLTLSTPAGKLFTVFYIFAGLGIVIGFVNAVARTSVEQGTREGRGLLMRRSRRREPADGGRG